MDDEQNPIAEGLAETPTILEVEDGSETETIEQPETEALEEPAEEFETIEFDGKQYQIPAALKDGFLMRERFTQKTQALADERRDFEAKSRELAEAVNSFRQQFQASDDDMKSRATLVAIDTALEHYAEVDWHALTQRDPVGAQQQWMKYQNLKEQRGGIAQQLHQRQIQQAEEAKRDVAKRFAETEEWAAKNIKGWSKEVDSEIIKFARLKGATDQDLRNAMSPMIYNLLHLARIGEQALSKATTVPKVAPAGQPPKPLQTVGGKSNPSAGKSLADMSMDEYAEHRRAQMGRGR